MCGAFVGCEHFPDQESTKVVHAALLERVAVATSMQTHTNEP